MPPTDKYRIFIASPGDVEAERQIARRMIGEINHDLSEMGHGERLELLNWEDMHPDLGNPQTVILNQALLKKCDIFITILWKHFGRPPGGKRPADRQPYLSGTQREIDEAIAARRASKIGRPVIMIYRKTDPAPIDMSDEEFRQLARVRSYLRQFEPEGENPALISRFISDQFEAILRRDLLQVIGEFEHTAVVVAEPALTPTTEEAAQNTDEPEPSDSLDRWLQLANLGSHPFEQNRAEEERALPRYFVAQPGVRVQALAAPVKPTIVFGNAGSGKTALRTMVAGRGFPQRLDSDVLCIVLGRKELSGLVRVVDGKVVSPAPLDLVITLARIVLAHLRDYTPSTLTTLLHEYAWIQGGRPDGSVADYLESLADVIRAAQFQKVVFLLDQLDELPVLQAQPDLIADAVQPLMSLELREARTLAFVYFLPDAIASQLRSRNRVFRLDRCDVIELRWSEDTLRRLIRQRLVYHSINKSAPYSSIGELCESTDGLAGNIDAEMITLSAGNPRALLWLAQRLIHTHCLADSPPRLIRPKTWEDVKTQWWLEGRALFFPSILFWVWQDRVYFHAREIVLSGLSLSLLKCLIRAEGRVCDRQELARAGWPDAQAEGVSQRAIDEAVRRLKLDLDKFGVDTRWVQTVRGRGFRLAAPDRTSVATSAEEDESYDER